jgi:hypothetical protein
VGTRNGARRRTGRSGRGDALRFPRHHACLGGVVAVAPKIIDGAGRAGSDAARLLPDSPVEFFDLWPERDDELNGWYDKQCLDLAPWFELHGHGYGPLWFLARGQVLDCLNKPYEYRLADLQRRAADIFAAGARV